MTPALQIQPMNVNVKMKMKLGFVGIICTSVYTGTPKHGMHGMVTENALARCKVGAHDANTDVIYAWVLGTKKRRTNSKDKQTEICMDAGKQSHHNHHNKHKQHHKSREKYFDFSYRDQSHTDTNSEARTERNAETNVPFTSLPITRHEHPVIDVIRQRARERSLPGYRTDKFKVALAIEGGGMRGVLSAGMAAALKHLDYLNAFDCIYGSSAGAIIGAYLVSKQVPSFGCSIYYDDLCNSTFIDTKRLLWKPLVGKRLRIPPVLHLDLLLDGVMLRSKRLDWNQFWNNHQNQALKPVATCLLTGTSTVLDHFTSLSKLLDALRASARVPGIAGDPVRIEGMGIYGDAILSEPLPFRSAMKDGCTHILVLRTRPENCPILTKPGIFEKYIAKSAFMEAGLVDMAEFIGAGKQLDIYAKELKFLEEQRKLAHDKQDGPHVTYLAPPPHHKEVQSLEVRSERIFEAAKEGFATAYEALFEYATPGMGYEVAGYVLQPPKEVAKKRQQQSSQRKKETVRVSHEAEQLNRRSIINLGLLRRNRDRLGSENNEPKASESSQDNQQLLVVPSDKQVRFTQIQGTARGIGSLIRSVRNSASKESRAMINQQVRSYVDQIRNPLRGDKGKNVSGDQDKNSSAQKLTRRQRLLRLLTLRL